jgi:8-oxo-dGTP diphosphatase
MTVFAAGAICWREEKGELLVAVIHRGRYNDYGWPKGKVDPGESLPETAVREIAEETGLKIKLGVRLGVQNYVLPNGKDKEVHYWAARVGDGALAKSKFEPSEEVASIDWHKPEDARALLTYSHDQQTLDRLLELYEDGLLRTKPVVVLRHAKATPRADWKGGRAVDDGRRPLLPFGFQQANALIPLLRAFGIKRVVTSPWTRCRTTVEPFARALKLKIVERAQLSELGNKKGPKRTAKVVRELIEAGRPTVICSHRPALPSILGEIAKHGSLELAESVVSVSTLKPAEMMVAHMSVGAKRKIVAVEQYSPVIEE